jgi:hypothetical protein
MHLELRDQNLENLLGLIFNIVISRLKDTNLVWKFIFLKHFLCRICDYPSIFIIDARDASIIFCNVLQYFNYQWIILKKRHGKYLSILNVIHILCGEKARGLMNQGLSCCKKNVRISFFDLSFETLINLAFL